MYYYNQNDYSSLGYASSAHPKATIKTSGCGVVSTVIAVNNLAGKELFTVKEMRNLALSSGAREADGTNITALVKAVCKKYNAFSYKVTCSESELIAHLKSGGMAIANQGSVYNVFSTSGHFVVAYKLSGSNIEVVDPQMYSGKYDKSPRPSRIVKKTKHGCIVKTEQIAKATADRNPSYCLISYDKPKTEKKTTSSSGISYTVGKTYTLKTDLKVRTGAGTSFKQKKRSQLTASGKKNAKIGIYAVLKKGTKVTVYEVIKKGSNIWLHIPSGYIAAYYNGHRYV